MDSGSVGSGRRQARSIRNDGRILDAGYRILAERGWSGLGFSPVAQLAGLSLRPVRDRFAERAELASAIWTERIHPAIRDDFLALQEATDLVIKAGPQEADLLIASLRPFRRPEPRIRAAMELMIASGFDPVIRGALDSTLLPQLRRWATPGVDGLSRADAARRAYLISIALGMTMCGLQLDTEHTSLDDEIRLLAAAVSAPSEPVPQPSDTADHLDIGNDFGTGEPGLDNLLQVTLDQIGVRGYDATTTASIARASAHTEGFLFARYASKLDLFFDATARLIGRNTGANVAYHLQIATRYSTGMAEAVGMREFMRPGRERLRLIGLEQFRVGWHDERFKRMMNQAFEPFMDEVVASMAAAGPAAGRARAHMELVRGNGPIVLSQLLPETWELPYDVVTIPLLDQLS